MSMSDSDLRKDGFVTGRQLDVILTGVAKELASVISAISCRVNKQNDEINNLKSELDADRRLRLSMKRARSG